MPLSTAKQALNELASEWDGSLPDDRARAEAELAELALHLVRLAGQCGVDLAYVTSKRLHREAAAQPTPAPRYYPCSTVARHSRH
ncbi:MAG: hypothetical protein ABSH23_01815 [Steroidobacteraceae bacterium]|jgi:hypothetical protein